MQTVNITEAKAKFSEMVEKALHGENIIVTRMGKPVVKISRYEPAREHKRLGLMEGMASIPDDFDEWPEEEARALGILD